MDSKEKILSLKKELKSQKKFPPSPRDEAERKVKNESLRFLGKNVNVEERESIQEWIDSMDFHDRIAFLSEYGNEWFSDRIFELYEQSKQNELVGKDKGRALISEWKVNDEDDELAYVNRFWLSREFIRKTAIDYFTGDQ